mgnify:CR=1 FL=1
MTQHGQLQALGVDQGVPHQVGVVHVAAVVGQGDGARLFQGLGAVSSSPRRATETAPTG